MPKTPTSEIDALFELSLTEFTAARNSLAARLKKEGRAGEAETVKAMPKPPATAWAVNQLFWRQPREVERLFTIGEKVREAQSGSAADLRVLLDERRRVVSELTKRAAAILRDGGHADSQDAMRRVTTNLESLAAWGSSNAGAHAGRLTADLEPLGFDGLAALLDGKKLEPAKVLQFRRAAKEKKSEEDEAASRAQAKEAIKEAEKALTAARRDAERAEAVFAKAAARAQALEKQKQEMETRFKKAAEEARAASNEVKKRAQAVADAERALNRARAALP
ncbi:MAG TPA: hypothetical protein VGQ36_27530 [Thermoanaerobaculia bacterium]|nr:hypothetical protein [Thermoanaerobaculia bacterium]